MNSIFMNSKNSKIFDSYRLLVNLTQKINLTRSDKYVALPNLSIKNIKKSCKNSSSIKWRIWVTWWTIFYIRYSSFF